MPKRSRTFAQRERAEATRHEWTLRFLKLIQDELDPASFTLAELKAEFGTLIHQEPNPSMHGVNAEKELERLIGLEYVEKIGPDEYHVTQTGMLIEVPGD